MFNNLTSSRPPETILRRKRSRSILSGQKQVYTLYTLHIITYNVCKIQSTASVLSGPGHAQFPVERYNPKHSLVDHNLWGFFCLYIDCTNTNVSSTQFRGGSENPISTHKKPPKTLHQQIIIVTFHTFLKLWNKPRNTRVSRQSDGSCQQLVRLDLYRRQSLAKNKSSLCSV